MQKLPQNQNCLFGFKLSLVCSLYDLDGSLDHLASKGNFAYDFVHFIQFMTTLMTFSH